MRQALALRPDTGPTNAATVSSIASWSTGVAPFAPISEVPTIALAVRDSCPFDALTC
jgi:hypothetical protein